jgi:hypothetical protein
VGDLPMWRADRATGVDTMTPEPPSFWRRAHQHVALLYGIIGTFAVSAVALWLLRRYGLALKPQHVDRVFAGKLTFLSLGLATLAVQYHYFYQMRWTEGQRIRAGDTGWQREARQLLADAKDSSRTDHAFLEWKASVEKNASGEEYLQQMAKRNRPFFTAAFSFLLALLFSLLLSVIADFSWLLAHHDIEWLRYASAATFLTALATFVVAGGLGIAKLRTELLRFFDY